MHTITASQDRPEQQEEARDILSAALLLEAREFPSGVVIARFATEHGGYACTVERGHNLKLWMSDRYEDIISKYDFLTHSNLYSE
jgi:hypothetical protein|nr:MAG TPA: hypothetical protein [Caudoviricetes sp.]